jgi:hypothetical protein
VITIHQFVLGMILTSVGTAAGLLAFGLWLSRRNDAAADKSDNVHIITRGARAILVVDVKSGHQETVELSPDRAFVLARNLSDAANMVWRRKKAPTRMGVARFDMRKQRRRTREEATPATEEAEHGV